MRINRWILLLMAATLVLALSLSAVYAQEATCDADLILALYYAERFFDFSAFAGELPSDMAVDVDTFDKGQFEPLFDRVAGADALQMSDEMRNRVMELMAMSDADFDAEAASADVRAMTTLEPGDVTGESDECAALRSALRRFFTGLAFAEWESDGVSAGAEPGAATGGTGTTETGAMIVALTGAEEAPGPGDEDASGTAAVYLRGESNEVCVDIIVERMTLPATAAHIHRGAAGESGPPVVPLTAPNENGVSNTCAMVEAALMQELIDTPEAFYVNVHNADFPDGAARGQMHSGAMGAGTEPATTGGTGTTDTGAANAMIVELTGAEEAPGPGDEDASGTAAIYLRGNRNEVCVDIIVEDMTLPATAAHIHIGAAGESGPPVVTLTAPDANGRSNTCETVEAALMQELIDNPEDYYVNVHNADFPDGAARGQMH